MDGADITTPLLNELGIAPCISPSDAVSILLYNRKDGTKRNSVPFLGLRLKVMDTKTLMQSLLDTGYNVQIMRSKKLKKNNTKARRLMR